MVGSGTTHLGASPASSYLRHQSVMALQWRRIQRTIFPDAVRRESCWDIMLLCLASEVDRRPICVKQLSADLAESRTSVLRRIEELEQAAMLRRQRDDRDGRRTIVRLTQDGLAAMVAFFDLVREPSAG